MYFNYSYYFSNYFLKAEALKMANKRFLPCGKKEVYAIGAENSINDTKEKLSVCFNCYDFIDCKASQSLFDTLKNQQNIYIELRKNGFYQAQ